MEGWDQVFIVHTLALEDVLATDSPCSVARLERQHSGEVRMESSETASTGLSFILRVGDRTRGPPVLNHLQEERIGQTSLSRCGSSRANVHILLSDHTLAILPPACP